MGRCSAKAFDPFQTHRADGSVDPRGYLRSLMRDGFLPALREDIGVLRAFMRVFNLSTADRLMKTRLLGTSRSLRPPRRTRSRTHGPTREQVAAHLGCKRQGARGEASRARSEA